tara:strand:- start:266 stop:670 length:405 start_codon:yes stop_codon:yes gene_type:complete
VSDLYEHDEETPHHHELQTHLSQSMYSEVARHQNVYPEQRVMSDVSNRLEARAEDRIHHTREGPARAIGRTARGNPSSVRLFDGKPRQDGEGVLADREHHGTIGARDQYLEKETGWWEQDPFVVVRHRLSITTW